MMVAGNDNDGLNAPFLSFANSRFVSFFKELDGSYKLVDTRFSVIAEGYVGRRSNMIGGTPWPMTEQMRNYERGWNKEPYVQARQKRPNPFQLVVSNEGSAR